MDMNQEIRTTGTLLKVLAEAEARLPNPFCGADVMNSRRVLSGSLYPLLDRLVNAGWVDVRWEDIDPVTEGRPRKRLYTFTNLGRQQARRRLSEVQIDPRRGPDPVPA